MVPYFCFPQTVFVCLYNTPPTLTHTGRGDVDLNPRPTHQQKSNKSAMTVETQDFSEILLQLEKRVECGQESSLETQNQMLAQLSTIEEEFERLKVDISDQERKLDLESKVRAMSNEISFNCDNDKDLQYLLGHHEQYSRKKSIRLRGVVEEMGEDFEKITLDTLKKELVLDVDHSKTDIVHHVGHRDNSNPRSSLVKFLSHKSKDLVMRSKRKATHLK